MKTLRYLWDLLDDAFDTNSVDKKFGFMTGLGGVIFGIVLLLLRTKSDVLINQIGLGYLGCVLLVSGFLMLSFSFASFNKRQKTIKKLLIIIFLILFGIIFLPYTVYIMATDKLKMILFKPDYLIYLIALLILDYIVGIVVLKTSLSLLPIYVGFISAVCAISLAILLIFYFVDKLFVYILWRVMIISKEEKLLMYGNLYVFIFAMAAFIALILNLINFNDVYMQDVVKEVNASFVIVIAFDRLIGKWKDKTKNVEELTK